MPRWMIYTALVLLILAMIPPALIARVRAVPNGQRRVHLVQDMDNQGKFRAQHVNPMFADGRAMRPPVTGTVARGELNEDAHFVAGVANAQWAAALPARFGQTREQLDALMGRGRERFDIYCQPCHGIAAYGDGIVHKRANQLMNAGVNGTTWVQPKNLHEPQIRSQPIGQIFNTITHGIRTMAGYESQILPEDRWAIAFYVKALQRSQNAKLEDVPAAERTNLPVERLPAAKEASK